MNRELWRCSHPDFSLQHRDDLPHHSNQVLILVGVVCEPHSLSYGQDFFTDVAKKQTKNIVVQVHNKQFHNSLYLFTTKCKIRYKIIKNNKDTNMGVFLPCTNYHAGNSQ